MTDPQDFSDALTAGTAIDDYVLGAAIGQGGEGIVYLAEHPRFGTVVVKEHWPKHIVSRVGRGEARAAHGKWAADYRTGVATFLRRSERLKALPPHPGVVRVLDVFEANNTAYMVMELVRGQGLDQAALKGAFRDPIDVMRLADQLAEAIGMVHENDVLHRDISPDNVMITAGDDWQAVLIDFNAAKDMIARITRSGAAAVKAGYSPIEQYDQNSSDQAGPWTDIYSASAVIYRLVAGHPPLDAPRRFQGGEYRSLTALAPTGYPPAFLAAIDAGLAPRIEQRPRDADAWRRSFGFGLGAVTPPVIDPPPHGRRKAIFAGAVGVAILGVAALAFRPAATPGVAPTPAPSDSPSAVPSNGPFTPLDVVATPTPTPKSGPTETPTPTPTPTRTPRAAPTRSPDVETLPDVQKATAVPAGCETGPYIVFFEWEKSNVTVEAGSVLDNAIANWQGGCGRSVTVHLAAMSTGRNGSAAWSLALRRAQAVKSYLTAHGVSKIRVSAFARPGPEPANGVEESQWRRVEMTFGP